MASPILFLDGTNQRVIFELATASPSDDPVYRGASDGATLTNCNLKFKQFGGAWSTILSPTITWDETGQFWEAVIPHGLITTYGHAVIIILSTNSAFASLNILVTIVPPNSYFATAASITAIQGTGWTDETLVTIQAAAETGGTAQEVWEYTTRTLSTTPATASDITTALNTYDAPTKAELDAAIAGISVTVDGSDLVTLDTVITLPSGRTKTFEQILEDIYKYRKY